MEINLLYRSARSIRGLVLTFAFAFVLLNLSACSILSGISGYFLPKGGRLDWTGLTLIASKDANLNSALAVDLVLLRDEATMAAVAAMSAQKWFASRTDLLKTFPDGLRYVSMELAPGQTLQLEPNKFGAQRLVGAFVFADYLTPGEHRMRVDQLEGSVVVYLEPKSFLVKTALPR